MTSSVRSFMRLAATLRNLNNIVHAANNSSNFPVRISSIQMQYMLSCSGRAYSSESTDDSSSSSSSDSSSSSSDDEKLQLARPGKQAAVERDQRQTEINMKLKAAEEGIEPELRLAAVEAAESLKGTADTAQVTSDLLQRLKRPSDEISNKSSALNLEKIFAEMTVEEGPKMMKERPMRSARGRRQAAEHMAGRGQMQEKNWKPEASSRRVQDIQLFSGPDLGIFPAAEQPLVEEPILERQTETLWEQLESEKIQREIKRLPSNAFEEAIEWTEQGKLWKFPVDNEAELGAEADVGFHEHVFIDVGLKDIPEESAPVRRFMQLVQLGLSRNPHLTLAEKREHIAWYKQYFSDKLELAQAQKEEITT